jgi:2-dehydropantoate 2-reductase
MLQDVEKGNPLEIEALLGSVLELAELTETPTPLLRSTYACCNLLNHNLTAASKATDQLV